MKTLSTDFALYIAMALLLSIASSSAWTPSHVLNNLITSVPTRRRGGATAKQASTDETNEESEPMRRKLFQKAIQTGFACIPVFLPTPKDISLALEERCDASDFRCGPDGKLGELPTGKPIPKVTNRITHVVQIIVDIGERSEEAALFRFGLYGDDCPGSVKQMLQFLTNGISSMDASTLENSIGIQSEPVSLLDGGVVPTICSGTGIDFGVPYQSKAYAKSRGLRTAGPSFVPQTRPPSLENESFPRPHDVAGLVSIPEKGIGYGVPVGTDDDEAYSNAFTITADAAPGMDKIKRRVIGQVIDEPSMKFLARLSYLPIQKEKSGLLPGTTSGPPLLKVRVRDIGVQKVK